jgi:hypothetical protein
MQQNSECDQNSNRLGISWVIWTARKSVARNSRTERNPNKQPFRQFWKSSNAAMPSGIAAKMKWRTATATLQPARIGIVNVWIVSVNRFQIKQLPFAKKKKKVKRVVP